MWNVKKMKNREPKQKKKGNKKKESDVEHRDE